MKLINLVGEQPIPNLIPLWQWPDRFSSVQFAMTETTLCLFGRLKKIIESDKRLNRISVEEPLLLEAYNIQSAAETIISAASHSGSEKVLLNLTGGTKMMSIAAFYASLEKNLNFLYVTTQKGFIIEHNPGGIEISRELVSINVSVAQYMTAYGLEIYNPHPFSDLKPPKDGDELENLVYNAAVSSEKFDDVMKNVHIRRPGRVGTVKNELDVVLTWNGVMAICSCKSGRKINKEMLYELSSLSRRESAGIYCRKVFICSNNELDRSIIDRAKENDIRLIFGESLSNQLDEKLFAAVT